jgi:hypothetical protein
MKKRDRETEIEEPPKKRKRIECDSGAGSLFDKLPPEILQLVLFGYEDDSILRETDTVTWNVLYRTCKETRRLVLANPKVLLCKWYLIRRGTSGIGADAEVDIAMKPVDPEIAMRVRVYYARSGFQPLSIVAERGYENLIPWLMEETGWELSDDTHAWAAAGGRVETMKWLDAAGCPRSAWSIYYAARTCKEDALLWLLGENIPFDASSLARDLVYGDHPRRIPMLERLSQSHPHLLTTETCGAACESRFSQATLKWLLERGYWTDKSRWFPWFSFRCTGVSSGHVDFKTAARLCGANVAFVSEK